MKGTTEGMVGGGYYDAHSTFQADVAASGAALLEEAVAAVRATMLAAAMTLLFFMCISFVILMVPSTRCRSVTIALRNGYSSPLFASSRNRYPTPRTVSIPGAGR